MVLVHSIQPSKQPRNPVPQPMTIFQKISDVAGKGTDLESVPVHLFFKIFHDQMTRVKNICAEAAILDRGAEQVIFEVQLDGENETDRHLHELLSVVASRRMIEVALLHHDFHREQDLTDGRTFCYPMFKALSEFKIEVTLHGTVFRRNKP